MSAPHLHAVDGHAASGESADIARARKIACAVKDPEIPVMTVGDLGVLRDLRMVDGVVVAKVTPTYSGCPAVQVIEMSIESALRDAGFSAKVERVLAPPWTTDWITSEGRRKLKEFGIAPPGKTAPCPLCDSENTEKISEFGSTACKALYRCLDCKEPFDRFKCI